VTEQNPQVGKAIPYNPIDSAMRTPEHAKRTIAVERNHQEWVDNVKAHAKDSPLSAPLASYVSTPITEQDVVGVFHQFSALGLFPGMRILATSGQHTYDCYALFETKDADPLRYKAIDDNPLGLSSDVLAPEDRIS
jgi:hypothetical protein